MVTSRFVDVLMGASTTYAAGAGRTGAFPFDLTWNIEHFDAQVSDIAHSPITNVSAPFHYIFLASIDLCTSDYAKLPFTRSALRSQP